LKQYFIIFNLNIFRDTISTVSKNIKWYLHYHPDLKLHKIPNLILDTILLKTNKYDILYRIIKSYIELGIKTIDLTNKNNKSLSHYKNYDPEFYQSLKTMVNIID
jgi:hypothetical protein